jgi:ABC-type multidrug transport system fused ATPase/permease subunit
VISTKRLTVSQSARLLLRCFSYIKEYQVKYFLGLLFSSFELGILFAIPVINKKLVEMVSGNYESGTVWFIAVLFTLLLLLIPFVAIGKYWQNTTTARGVIEVRKALFNHIQNMPIIHTADRKIGDYVTRLTEDAGKAGNVFQSFAIVSLIRFVVVTIISLVLLLLTDWRIAAFSVLFNLLCLYLSTILNPYVQRLERDARTQVATSSSYLIEAMGGIPIVRIFLLKDVLVKKYRDVCEIIMKKRITFRSMNGIAYGVIDFFAFSAQALGFIIGMFFMLRGNMDLATCVYAASLMGLMSDAMLRFSTFLLLVQPSIVAAQRIFQVLDTPVEDVRETKIIPDMETDNAISLQDLSFTYPGGDRAIDNISLNVKRGEHLAVVGGSGGGKSTLIKLLQGFYEPTEGRISFFGVDTKELSIVDIRNLSAYVPQDCAIFDGTIGENIAFGRPGSPRDKVTEAAKQANIHEFIMSLPLGYDSVVGERGSQISGGQRQRVAIARAILKDSPILLLDEATAALDSTTEKEIYQEIETLARMKTTITIAHRLSTIQNADRIIVMEAGRIVEEGTHQELLDMKRRYRELWEKQF